MGLEPYLLRSTLQTVVCQRLLRKRCDACRQEESEEAISQSVKDSSKLIDTSAADVAPVKSCSVCGGLKYHGRFVMAEMLDPNLPEVARAIMDCADARTLQSIAIECGAVTLRERGQQAVDAGTTTPEEIFRVLGR